MTASPPVRSARARAYLITNAQVTGASRSVRRPRRRVLTTMRALVRDGMAEATGPLRARRPLDGSCTDPVHIEEVGGSYSRPIIDTFVRCRKCEACLKHRRSVWTARASFEIGAHERTWMVTLTMDPANQHRMRLLAARRLARNGDSLEGLPADRQFAEVWREFGVEVTKYFKRLRSAGAAFDYLQVVEAHKSGLPHVHVLLHERAACTYRLITGRWQLGFAHAKLVEGTDAARYVTKYLMKSALARVRASVAYGSPPQGKASHGPPPAGTER